MQFFSWEAYIQVIKAVRDEQIGSFEQESTFLWQDLGKKQFEIQFRL